MKKLLCITICLLMILSAFVVPVSASEQSTIKDAVLHFDTNTVTKIWGPFQKIYCHIWEYGKDPFYHWGNKEQLCTDTDGDGIYTYNLTEHNITLKENTQYACIFYSNSGNEHYPLLFDATVLGDTAYCTNEYYEGMSDSGRYEYFAYWRNQDPKKHGPCLEINSIGLVYGTCIPQGISTIDMFEGALINVLDNARVYSGNSDQKIIDYLAYKLSLSSEQVQQAIVNSGEKVEWEQELSTADKLVGDADLDGEVSILDATEIQLHLASLVEFTDEQVKLADIDFFKGVNILDVTSIQLKLAGYFNY
ncbi:MAG: dockerin type I repeat-containing protein [Ruminococcus sp.]|nr:dockerin type I repeat-containing protein [Ruminococcus sp.]